MSFDFRQIAGPKDSKQENFSALCSRLIMQLYPKAKAVDGKGGDEGLDTFIGVFNGECHAFQHKYFIERVGKSQRSQLKRSIETSIRNHKIKKWTLLLPIELNPAELKWFQGLEKEYDSISMDWWGDGKLQNLLSEHQGIAQDFCPIVPIQITLNVMSGNIEEIAAGIINAIDATRAGRTVVNASRAAASEVLRRARLKILLWGASALAIHLDHKRFEICTKLRQLGHDAHLCETVWTPHNQTGGLNLTMVEFVQAQAYDYIIVFMETAEATMDVQDIMRTDTFASRTMICIDSRYQDKYDTHHALSIFEGGNGKLHWFDNPFDVTQCHLATCVIAQLHRVVEAKQWAIANGGIAQ